MGSERVGDVPARQVAGAHTPMRPFGADALGCPGVHLVVDSWTRAPLLAHLLDPGETARADSFRAEQARAEFIVGRALAKALVGAALGVDPVEVAVTQRCGRCGSLSHGRPVAAAGGRRGPHFSVSHSGGHVVLAVSGDGPVGVDVEVVRPIPELRGLAESVLAPRELVQMDACDGTALDWFFRRWCVKEALTKRDGVGLVQDLRTVTADGPGVTVADVTEGLPEGVVGAVALPSADAGIHWWAAPEAAWGSA